jgi:hypothetical protein
MYIILSTVLSTKPRVRYIILLQECLHNTGLIFYHPYKIQTQTYTHFFTTYNQQIRASNNKYYNLGLLSSCTKHHKRQTTNHQNQNPKPKFKSHVKITTKYMTRSKTKQKTQQYGYSIFHNKIKQHNTITNSKTQPTCHPIQETIFLFIFFF